MQQKRQKPILIKPKRLARLIKSKTKDKIIKRVIRDSVSITLTNLGITNIQRRAQIQKLWQHYINANLLGDKEKQLRAIHAVNAVLFEHFENSTKSRNATLRIIDDFQKNLLTSGNIL